MKAVERGYLEMVRFIANYFKSHNPPREFDIYAEDERTGENSAQLAAKAGHLDLLILLYGEFRVPLQ
jgi:hypothetical protein